MHNMNNSRTYIKKVRGYNTSLLLIIITLGFYVPYFYSKFIPKINAMTHAAFNTKIKEFNTGLYSVGWCGILAPFFFVLAKMILLNEELIATVMSIIHTTNTVVLVGVLAVWTIIVFVMYRYGSGRVRDCNEQILRLAEHYTCDKIEQIRDDYEYALDNLKLFESKGVVVEKFNFKMANVLIEKHNNLKSREM